ILHPRSSAMRCAIARAATRRGCRRIRGPSAPRSSSTSAGGIRVVLPAPGCAETTTARDRRRCSTISPMNGSTGSDSLGSDANAHGTRHTRAAETAIAVGVFREVLLMVILSVVELRSLEDLGRDLRIAGGRQLFLVGVARGLRGFPLLLA